MKNIAILGATGSIGLNTLEVIKQYKNKFHITAITCNKNTAILNQIIEEFSPDFAVITDKNSCNDYEIKYKGKTKVLCGEDGIHKIIELSYIDLFVNAISGFAGCIPTIEILKKGKEIALANKESIVIFGDLITREQYKLIIPVDSEHNAIYQCLSGEKQSEVKRIILTASGGPFLHRKSLEGIGVKETLEHPTWRMGKKITVDSATLINKGYEIIEAHHLFNLPINKIDVLIHPQSIVHSIVEFQDNSAKALLSIPDMKLPIEYALIGKKHGDSIIPPLDLSKIGHLDFYEPNTKLFKGLEISRQCAETGGTMPAVLNAADEIAVKRFLNGEIEFLDIIKILEKTIKHHKTIENPGIKDIIKATKDAYEFAKGVIV